MRVLRNIRLFGPAKSPDGSPWWETLYTRVKVSVAGLSLFLGVDMESFLTSLKIVAFTINFCVFVINARLMLVKCLEIKFTHILDERRLSVRENLMIERERWRAVK